MTVPFVDLVHEHEEIAQEVLEGWARVTREARYILGNEVKEFERAFALFSGAGRCVGVANGTDALELILRAAEVGPGDEVIVPTNSFIASAFAVVRAGATPVLVDCDPIHYLINLRDVAARLTTRTKAIVPVHLFGQLAPMEELRDLAGELLLIEDAAQAHGATRNGVGIGGFGVAAATSFYPSKNLGSYGDAGAVVTNSDELAETIVSLRNHGSRTKYLHEEVGFNSRLDTLQAVVLLAKIRRLATWNEMRRKAARNYDVLFKDLEQVTIPETLPGNVHVWHLYVIRVPARDQVRERLWNAGIQTGIHYPTPIHQQGAFSDLGYKSGEFPNAEAASREILSLPIYPQISPDQQEQVVQELTKALR